jgi:hypothetical protein
VLIGDDANIFQGVSVHRIRRIWHLQTITCLAYHSGNTQLFSPSKNDPNIFHTWNYNTAALACVNFARIKILHQT